MATAIDTHAAHTWTRTDNGYACEGCPETSAACIECHRPTGGALLICEQCLLHERSVLDGIDRILTHWDEADRYPHKSPMAFSLVRSSAGSGSGERLRHPEDVKEVQLWWVALWSEHMPNPGMDAATYLKAHLMWAAHNPECSRWRDYQEAMRSLRSSARAVVGLAPTRLPDRCMHCGGKVVQDRADKRGEPYDDGLQDVVRCTGCTMQWSSRAAFQINVRHHIHELPGVAPQSVVTREQARKIFPDVPPETWRKWVSLDRINYARSVQHCDDWDDRWTAWEEAGNIGPIPCPPEIPAPALPECTTRRGEVGYRLVDLHRYASRRTSDTRTGRPATAVAG